MDLRTIKETFKDTKLKLKRLNKRYRRKVSLNTLYLKQD